MNNQKLSENINEKQQPGTSSQSDKKQSQDNDSHELIPPNQVFVEVNVTEPVESPARPLRIIPANTKIAIFTLTEMNFTELV
jgi:hypothetical protein